MDSAGRKRKQKGVDAQFDLQTEKLAFVVRTNMGEADYRTIYAKPSDKLMNVLENNTDAIYMYLNCLPDNIFEITKGASYVKHNQTCIGKFTQADAFKEAAG